MGKPSDSFSVGSVYVCWRGGWDRDGTQDILIREDATDLLWLAPVRGSRLQRGIRVQIINR